MIFRVSLSQKFLFGWGLSAVAGLVLVGITFSLALKRYHQLNANVVIGKSFRIVKAQLNLRAQHLDSIARNLAQDRFVTDIVMFLNAFPRQQPDEQNVSSRIFESKKRKLIQRLNTQIFFSDDLYIAVYGRDRKLLAYYKRRSSAPVSSRDRKHKTVMLPVIMSALAPSVALDKPKDAYRIVSGVLFYTRKVPVLNARSEIIGTLVASYRLERAFVERISQLLDEPVSIRVTRRDEPGVLGELPINTKLPLPDLFGMSGAFTVIPNKVFFVGATQINTSNVQYGEKHAFVMVGVDKQIFVAGFRELRKSILWTLAVIALVILPFGAYFIWRNLTRPVAHLMFEVDALMSRESENIITLKSQDELGMLAQSLNEMAQTIKTREHDLKSSRDQLRLITDNLPFLIAYVDAQRIYRFVNRTCSEWCALPPEKMIGLSSSQILGNEYHKFALHVDEVLNGKSVTYENTVNFPDGVTRMVRISYIAHRGAGGAVEGFFAIAIDKTEIRHAEEQLRHAQKMESVGQLTGGIAHDFNNILNIVMGNLELLQRMDLKNEKVQERLESALSGVRRGADLTRKLLGFSRRNPWGVEVLSVNQAIKNVHSLITKSLMVAISVEIHLSDDLWLVEMDPGDFEDIILNLALNARDAMPAGGLLVIETQNRILDENYVRSNPEGSMGEHIMISLSDTGTGMVADVCERIFDPFFTTKGDGTGLGLSMVYGSVQRAGGQIKVYSVPGEGTTFRIYLPRASGDLSEHDPRSEQELPRGTQTVLIVDDEEELIDAAHAHIVALGYKAYTATNAKQALKIIEDDPSIDLLFTDVVMPGGRDGYQLAMAALKIRPALKILITSGFTQKREEFINGDHAIMMKLAGTLLSKPYGVAELAVAIRRTLDSDA